MRRAVIRRLVELELGPDTQDIAELVLQAWERLERRLPRVAQTLDLHHGSGYSIDDVAAILGSQGTSAVDLRFGHAWLVRDLRSAFTREPVPRNPQAWGGVQQITLAGH